MATIRKKCVLFWWPWINEKNTLLFNITSSVLNSLWQRINNLLLNVSSLCRIKSFNQGENMKDFKSMVIGFLLATCMFLFMGQISSNKAITIEEVYDVVNTTSIDVKEIKKTKC